MSTRKRAAGAARPAGGARRDKAWGTAAPSEARWPASLSVVFAAALNFLLPGRFTLGPPWLIPAIEMAILIPLYVSVPRRRPGESRIAQFAAIAVIGLVSFGNLVSLYALIRELLFHAKDVNGVELLYSSVTIWLTNVIAYGLWFWELDRGGPDDRLSADHGPPDFLFPQMSTPGCTYEDWSPRFMDYLYVSFTNGTAFSPTDTMPLSRWAKVLMMLESLVSLATVSIVASRAVNIIG